MWKVAKVIRKDLFVDEIVDACVIDGPAFVHINAPMTSNNYGEYCNIELTNKIRDIAARAITIDLVFYIYRDISSIKRETRVSRGVGCRISDRPETPSIKGAQGASS